MDVLFMQKEVLSVSFGCGDAATFCYAIQQMSLLHGKDLDECVGRVTGSSAGYFDEEDEAEREEVRHG
ncbi:MAG: hypothetical protein H0T80_06755 [Betaproteobacteria bacterium]|nr:hypothetical protein [Betaproteobacteria bacterium]